MITAEDLKRKWIRWVKQLTGVDEYRVAKSFNRSFAAGAKVLNSNPSIDPDRFCRVQVTYALNKQQRIYPTLLSGRSLDRYWSFPSAAKEEKAVRDALSYEMRDFASAVAAHGFDIAIRQQTGHTPVFLGLMYFDYRQQIPSEILAGARSELKSEPAMRRILPAEYVRSLEG